jgi:hypothetical protein
MNLLRATIAASMLFLGVICLGTMALLSFLGYLTWLAGFSKAALGIWALAICPLALLGIVAANLPGWMRKEGGEPTVSYDRLGNQRVRYPTPPTVPEIPL